MPCLIGAKLQNNLRTNYKPQIYRKKFDAERSRDKLGNLQYF